MKVSISRVSTSVGGWAIEVSDRDSQGRVIVSDLSLIASRRSVAETFADAARSALGRECEKPILEFAEELARLFARRS